jgi:hypothetical protein
MAWRFAKNSFFCILVILCVAGMAAASEYHGQVTFAGLPVPGVTITATQGEKKVGAVTDQGGRYDFSDLADGAWKIEIEMQCFSTIHADVTVAPNMAAGKWELTLLPLDQLMVRTKVTQAAPNLPPTLIQPAPAKKAEGASAAATAPEIPKPQDEQSQQSADGFLVNGSVNNAATSQYSLDQAFGNRRPNSKSLYTGGFAAILNNSALDARPYSLSGLESPKTMYDRITGIVSLGGPIRIPHVMAREPNFFAGYQWTRDHTAAILSGLVPTEAERTGDLSGLLNAQGQPITIYNPTTGLPFTGNQVPVSTQAQALLALYPLPNIADASGYNYQIPVLNSSHQDVVQARLNKTLGRKDQLYGAFNLQSIRAGNENLFGFVDTTDTLGINSNVNWAHRFSQHLFVHATYEFSRLRTRIGPEFEDRENIAFAAGIGADDQDPTDWGPPTLNFSSGIYGLSDANSLFNRNRTYAFLGSAAIYRGHHNVTVGVDFRKQQYNDFFEQNPRGAFTFTGAATTGTGSNAANSGSDLADFLLGIPDTSSIAFGNADKYFRQPVFDAYANDDWRILSNLTINAGMRWDYGGPMTELKGRLVNLDITANFTAAAAVLGSDPVGPLTGMHYPSSLIRPDLRGFEPRIGIAWRPIPASTVLVRASYGVYDDTSVYQAFVPQLAQQAPLSTSVSVQNSAACPLTLANGFSCPPQDTFAVDPNLRIGYSQNWQLSVQRDLPGALQITATYAGIKGTHGAQQILPNTYPIGATSSCPSCPVGFDYRTSGGKSTRESGQVQLRRRLRSGFTASLLYTYSKSIDDDATLGGQGHVSASDQGSTPGAAAIAQNWLNPRAERALSTFDQRHLLNAQAQYTSGQGLGGGDLMRGWSGRLLKEWTVVTTVAYGTGLPENPSYLAAVPGTGFTGTIRPNPTRAPIYLSRAGAHLNVAAYTAPLTGQWGTAGRDSITGPSQFSLDSSLERTFRLKTKLNLTVRVDATNVLNHGVFTGWNSTWTANSTIFGLPTAANPMRSLQTTIRLRF